MSNLTSRDARGADPVPLLERLLKEVSSTGLTGDVQLAGHRCELVSLLKERYSAEGGSGGRFVFVFPQSTESLSGSGGECSLNCAHCDAHYLEHMTSAEQLIERFNTGEEEAGPKSWLVSGGCDVSGGVNLPADRLLEQLADRGHLNFHVGLASSHHIDKAARFADSVCIDMIGSDETIREVMGLDRTVGDYLRVLDELTGVLDVPVVPHVVIGLHAGEIVGEFEIIQHLAQRRVQAVEFLIFRPTPKTPFARLAPPPLEEVLEVFLTARRLLPKASLGLGCMRPSGRYRQAADLLAAACDFDVLVQPTARTRRVLLDPSFNIEVRWGDQCCALYINDAIEPVGQFDDVRQFRSEVD